MTCTAPATTLTAHPSGYVIWAVLPWLTATRSPAPSWTGRVDRVNPEPPREIRKPPRPGSTVAWANAAVETARPAHAARPAKQTFMPKLRIPSGHTGKPRYRQR